MQSLYVAFPGPCKVEVGEEPVPTPGAGEVLCAAEKSLISIGTESFCLRGSFDAGTNWADWVRYPFRPGYSMSARVVAIGSGVSNVKEGDRVFAWVPHQRFFSALPEQLYPIPEGLSSEEATWGCLGCTTQLAVRRAESALGETAGVVGLGQLGQLVVQYLYLAGARRIIAIDTIQSRLDLASAHGATHTLCMQAGHAREAIADMTQGRMLDAAWDVTGHPAALSQCVQLLRRLGRVVLVGDTPTPTQQPVGPGVVSNTIAILGVHGGVSAPAYSEWTPWTRREITALFFEYLLQKRMRVADLVTHRCSPREAPQVYQGLLTDRSAAMGDIFDWSLL